MWSSGIAFSSHIREYSCNKKKESYTFEDQVFDTVTHYVPPCEDSEVDIKKHILFFWGVKCQTSKAKRFTILECVQHTAGIVK